jgi:putative Mg2+ transporter-C (MgtC) family protein
MNDWHDLTLRILAGMFFGILIGLERQYRARTAGLRTNALVALGAALFVIMGAYSFNGTGDPTRVAAQIVSGIGFLGAGVIMKQGASISGLNTAATLWASAAVGAMAGAGMIPIAAFGTLAVITANVLLRPIARRLDRRPTIAGTDEEKEVEYTFEVRCVREHEVETRAIVFNAVHRDTLTVQSIAATDLPDDIVVITAVATSRIRNDHEVELAIADIVPIPEVIGIRWTAEEYSATD